MYNLPRFQGARPILFLIYKYDTQLFSGCPPKKILGRFYRVDFTGYPSNQFSGHRLNGQETHNSVNWTKYNSIPSKSKINSVLRKKSVKKECSSITTFQTKSVDSTRNTISGIVKDWADRRSNKLYFNFDSIPFFTCYVVLMYFKFSSRFCSEIFRYIHTLTHGLRTPNEGINQRYLKIWADVADKICCRHT